MENTYTQTQTWLAHKEEILSSAIEIIAINEKKSFSTKSLFVSSIYSRTKTFANNGNVYIVEKSIQLIRELNSKYKPIITERHKFFKLMEIAEVNK